MTNIPIVKLSKKKKTKIYILYIIIYYASNQRLIIGNIRKMLKVYPKYHDNNLCYITMKHCY